ncbi:DUF4347 domain-containing protein [Azospirillum brasilense]|uniref:DUF4347 domain-containing protein n=1 Tax=Azospirillum brasilense TaxID=192 RepID=UPI00298DB33F|nr:DUF4347 domain-containing protein [Azospirillum brasilense]MDW7629421.1 DUF4347 domain-containing protein [Azospirillum brasilense]
MALEPRFMFDAAGAVTVAEVHHQPDQPAPGDKGAAKAADADKLVDWAIKESTVPAASSSPAASTPSPTEPAAVTARLAGLQGAARSVVFVDTSVSDYQTLLKDIAPDAKVVLLDPQQEALGQMAKALSGMSGLDSVQVVSHGGEGHLYMAGRVYWTAGLDNRAADFQTIGAALRPGGDILFYACNVGAGEAGKEFVETVHRLTGADVAASSDDTGSGAGKNWTLEVKSGSIEASNPFAATSMEAFSGTMADLVVTSATGGASVSGSLSHAIVGATDGQVILFSPTLVGSKVRIGDATNTALQVITDKGLTINGDVDGDGIADIVLSGDNNNDNVTDTSDYRGIHMNASGFTLNLKNLTFERFYNGGPALQGVVWAQAGTLNIEGVTFRYNYGTAVTAYAAATLSIKNSSFLDGMGTGTSTNYFAAIRSVASSLVVDNTVIANNSYASTYNDANLLGGMIVISPSTGQTAAAFDAKIRNTTIVNNVTSNTPTNNPQSSGHATAGISVYGASANAGSKLLVTNTIIAGNSGNHKGVALTDPNSIKITSGASANVALTDVNNYMGTIGGTATFHDAANRDYRPAATATSFINAGNGTTVANTGGNYDIRGMDRIRDGALDLGAYEVHWNVGEPSVDLNGVGAGTGESVSTSTPASGVLIASNAVLTQTDSDTRLLGATITLSGTSDGAAEMLSMLSASVATARGYGISVTGNDTTTITLRGAADLADYQAVVRLIQYKNTAGSFTTGTRTATVTVNDGETTSTARTSSITLNAGGSDTTPPTVSSIAVSGTPAANASSVSYTVTFSEGVTGVDAADFTLATTGTANGTIGTVTQVSSSVYTVTVTGVTGTGTLGLNLKGSGTGIKDTANNDITAGFTGSTHTVDRDAPVFTSSATPSVPENTTAVVTLAATDSNGPVTYSLVGGADQASFSLSGAALTFATAPDYESPTDSDGNNVYVVIVRATDANGNTTDQTISVTVTDVNEASPSAAPVVSGLSILDLKMYVTDGDDFTGGANDSATAVPVGVPGSVDYQAYASFDMDVEFLSGTAARITLVVPPTGFNTQGGNFTFSFTFENGPNGSLGSFTQVTKNLTSSSANFANESQIVGSVNGKVFSFYVPGTFAPTGQGVAVGDKLVFDIVMSVQPSETLSYTAGSGAQVIDQGTAAAVTDSDSTTFNGGNLTVAVDGVTANDVLGIRNQGTGAGQIGVSGSNVTYGGSVIGTVAGGNGADLIITFNANADAAAVSALMANITYATTSTANSSRLVSFTVTDDTGNTSLPGFVGVSVAAGDTTAPAVNSIAVSGTPAANASSITYTVTFSEGVSGVDAADFTLATTGTASGTIGTVTQVSASVYTVSVTGISGAGTLGLNLKGTGTGIKDTANNDIAAGFTGGTHTVDQVAPTFDVAAATSSITNTGFTLSASLNEAGTIYYVLVPRNATAPTAAEVETGTASGGGTALKSGSLSASSAPFDGSGSITGLTVGTAYDLYVVAKDSAGNLMSAPVKVSVTTTGGATNGAPVNSVVPTVTGTATVGNTLSGGSGTWSDPDGDSLSYSYQWYRADDVNGTNAASISGATSSNYTLTTSDAHKYLRVVVTANDGNSNTTTAYSAYTAILNSAPVNGAVPTVTGTATVGNALSTTNGTWSDPDGDGRSYSYQWYRADDVNGTNAASISGATGSNYTLTASDAHKYLRVVVTANDGKGGTPTASSGYTEILNSAPVNSAVPTVTGTATVGNALSTTNGTWSDPDGDGRSYSYQWYRADDVNGTNAASISGATSSSYTLTASDAHKYLRVVVTANDGKGGTPTASSGYTEILNSAPVNSAVPTVTGTATVGNALSTTNGTWSDPDGDGRSYSYQWYRADDVNGTNAASISGAISSSYTLTTSDAHKYLRVVVTANDGKGGTQTASSGYTEILNSAPVLSTDARSLTAIEEDATGNNGDTVAAILASAGTATDVDGNALGIAITAIDSSNGTWQYKSGAGTWTTITGVSGASALLLAGTDRVRFVPNADYNGSVVNGITFKAWDQTSGTAGTTVGNDTTANGGLGAGGQFSVASATVDIEVAAVNDAPVLTDSVLTLPSVAQAAGAPNGAVGVAVSSLVALGANVSDVDSGAVTGIALVGLDNSEGGIWYYSTDGGTSWTAVGTVNDSGNALLLRTTDRLYYQPTGANAGILSAAITFRAWDQTSGTAGTKVATAGGGGISAFSAATDTASLSITPAALGSAVTLAPASDTGNSNTDNITKASSVTFNGSGANANANTTVRLYANGSLVATTAADASGAYSFTGVDVSGLSGAVDFTVRQVIAGMESADSAVRTVTFDRTAPTVSITTVTGDNVLNAAESAVPQTVAGTTTGVEDGQTVTVTLNGKTYSTTVTNNAWSLSIPSADLLALPDGGAYTITADLADVAGNAAVQATRSVSVDRTPPTLAIATVAGDNVLNAADSAVGQTVSGVTNGVEDGQTITVMLNGKSYSTTVTNNRWSLTVPSGDLLALTDGANYTVTASLTDAAGNPTQATRNVSVDRTPPSVVSVTPPPARTYLPGETVSFFVQLSEASIINGGSPVLELAVGSEIRNAVYNAAGSTGTLLRFDYVVPVGDRAPQGIAVLGLALNGSIVTDAAQGPLVTALKGVGDTSQVRIDTPIPAKPVGTALSGLSDSGMSATDRLTNVTRPTLSGTAEANATVTVLVDGKAVGTAVADENGFWVHRLQTALSDGTHSITTTATNRFGIVSDPSDALAVVIDTAVPVAPAPSVTSATVAGAAAGERISGIATPSLAGTTEAGSTVNVLVDGKVAGTALADANGAWTFQFTAALADGTHSLQVQATDKAGNVSSLSAVTTLTIDTTPPLAPTVTLNTTVGSTPVVQGTAEANSLVTVTINGQAVGTARASAAGAWQLALAGDLSVGSYVIAAKASDAVGNTGSAGTTTYSVAPPPPPPAVVVASTGNTTTAASSSNFAVATAAGTGTTQTTGPTLGTAPTLPSLQMSSDAGRVITSSSIGNGSGTGNGNSSTDAGRSITIGNLGNSSSSDAGRSITISAMGGAPSGGGTASSSSGVLGGGTGGSSGSGLSGVVSGGSGLGSGGLGGGVGSGSGLGGSGLGGTASGGIGAGVGFGGVPAGGGPGVGLGTGGTAAGGPATGTGTGNGGVSGPVGVPGAASGGTPGGSTAPGGPSTATGGFGGAPGNRPGGPTGPGSTIENAPANRPADQGGPQGQPQGQLQGQPQGQGQPPAGDAPAGGDPGNAPAGADGSGQAPGPRADLDGSPLARPAFSRQVAQIHGAADAQTAALLAALTSHVPPGSRAA